MATPLRKDRPENEELTTADIAKGQRPANEPKGPQPVSGERPRGATPAMPAGEQRSDDRNLQQMPMAEDSTPLFPNNELEGLRTRWKEIQTAFVDEPRKAVEQADGLVASAMKRLAEVFAEERAKLEKQWDRGDTISTEDLRVALQRYRTFFHRLLSV